MRTIQKATEAIYAPVTEEEFQKYRRDNPKAYVLNAQLGWTNQGRNPDGQYMIHQARCHTLAGNRHVEGQADTRYPKYLCLDFDVLNRRYPGASLCSKCIRKTSN